MASPARTDLTVTAFDPSSAQAGGGFDPSSATLQSGGSGRTGTYSYDELQHLWTKAGGDPRYAKIMARVALAESSGSPTSNSDNRTSYIENGKRYYPRGLWQISTVHGQGNWYDPLTNARKAVELFNAQQFSPWEASRNGGAGGGWGKYVQSELMPYVETGKGGARPPGTIPNVDPEPLYHRGGQEPGQIQPTGVAYAGVNLTFDPHSAQVSHGFDPSTARTGGGPSTTAAPHSGFHLPTMPQHPPAPEAAILKSWEWARSHAGDAFFETLNTTSRAFGTYVAWLQTPEGQRHESMLHAIGDAIFHPHHPADAAIVGQAFAPQSREDAATAAQQKMFHLPSDQVVRSFVDSHVPKEWAPIIGSVAQGLDRSLAQTLGDPLTYIPLGDVLSGGIHGMELVVNLARIGAAADRAAAGTRVLHEAAKAAGVSKLFPHLGPMSDDYWHLGQAVGDAFNKIPSIVRDPFTTRPELDSFFQGKGKDAFLAIERGARFTAGKGAELDATAVGDGLAAVRQRARKYGASQATLSSMAGATKEEWIDELKTLRNAAMKKNVVRDTKQLLSDHPELQKPGTKIDWGQFPPGAAKLNFGPMGKFVGLIRNQIRNKMFGNPFPHFFRNVGELMTQFTGISSAPRGVYYAIRGVPSELKQRLESGAMETYSMGRHKSFYSMVPGVGPWWDKWLEQTQKLGTRLEEGWRAAALEVADQRLGPSRDKLDELMKLQLVAKRIGDPHNQAAAVRFFEAFGGPFLAYRFGIVPLNGARSIVEDPSRMLSLIRPQQNIQRSRSQEGQNMNALEFGGPPVDLAELAVDLFGLPLGKAPTKYVLSPSSLGPIGAQSGREQIPDQGPLETAKNIGWGLLPPEARSMYDISQGHAMPGPYSHGQSTYQTMSFADKVALALLSAAASYFRRQESPKTERRTDTEIERGTP